MARTISDALYEQLVEAIGKLSPNQYSGANAVYRALRAAPTESVIDTALVERMVTLVRQMHVTSLERTGGTPAELIYAPVVDYIAASEIAKLLLDPDLIEAREWLKTYADTSTKEPFDRNKYNYQVDNGEFDDYDAIRGYLAGKRTR